MADSATMKDLASQSLDLVNRELTSTLDTARREIEDYVDGHSSDEALLRAAGMLHLAAGALKIVEINGAALLAEEMEQTCRALTEIEAAEAVADGVEALTRAMVQLPAYLDRLLSGGRDVALVLLPLLNDLRRVRRKPLLSEGTMLLLNTGPFERFSQPAAAHAGVDYGRELQKAAQKLRPSFQTALLGWIRSDNTGANLDELIKTSSTLEKTAKAAPVKQLWSVLTAVLVALRADGLEASIQLKRLVGQADRQLKRLIDGGEEAFANAPPVELLNSFLYYVARARCDDERVVRLRTTYGLEDRVPGEEQLERAREGLAGPSVKLMHTVAEAIKEDLATVKDVLDIFVRTGMEDVPQLRPQLDMLKKIGDTLGVLGLEAARAQIQTEAHELGIIVASNRINDPAVLEKIAATLLDVEDALDRELVRAVLPGGGEKADEESEDTQYRHVTQAVMGECIVNLAKIKEAVVKLVGESGHVRALDQVKPQLRGITAGLLMLNKTRAVKIVERIGAMIGDRLAPSDVPLKPEHLERLADAIVSVEYYMETVSLGRTDPWYMLENAERCIELLERLPVPQGARAAVEPLPREARPAPVTVPPSVMQADDERSDPELVEIFIEEAKEELANIERCLPAWSENVENSEALISVRRSFHTLKGSGRMVGAQLLGEFAWSIENLLNRLINQTLAQSPGMLEFIAEASGALPALIEQLEIGIPPKVDIPLLMKRAEAFAEGDPEAANLTSESLRAQALAADEEPAAAQGGMDPVLSEIFVKEMRSHLATIRAYLAGAEIGPEPHAVTEPLHRACHTLLGSARMANCRPVMELAKPADTHLAAHYQAGSGLSAAGLGALRAFADSVEAMADALAAGRDVSIDDESIKRLTALALPETGVEAMSAEDASAPSDAASYDPEIASIFAEEAAELLDQAETALQDLESEDRTTVLHELQRLLHTLKGGARMAGVSAMGDLSHALETLLSEMTSGRAPADAETIELVQRCFDQLHQMRDAIDGGQAVPVAAPLISQIAAWSDGSRKADVARAPEAAPAAPEVAPAAPEVDTTPSEPAFPAAASTAAPPEPDAPVVEASPAEVEIAADWDLRAATGVLSPVEAAPEQRALDSTTPFGPAVGAGIAERIATEAPPPAPVEMEAEGEPAPAGMPIETAAEAQPQHAAQRTAERAETTRVDAALLDLLLNGAGEISIFQSRLNQQLHSIEFHLGELGQTVTRLREQLRNLEAETEAQILHRHQDDAMADQGFDPLELDRYSTIQQLSRALAETSNDVASINELLHGLTSEADTLLTQQARVTSELQDGLMQTRMVSLQRHVARLARIVRQAAADTGKSAELVVTGAGSELDRQVLDSILPAFEHLLRNAVVHGIEARAARRRAGKPETGVVSLNLRREGSEVLIEFADDGAGLNFDAIRRKAYEQGLIPEGQTASDEEAIDFILRPGFSTAGELTQAAGRGVGMDVVDNEIKKLGGSMRIESTPGQGTRFLIRLPYTLAITHALIVNVGDETFALPLPTVEGLTRVRREQLLQILTEDEPRLDYGDVSYRVQHLGSLVGAAPSAFPEEENAVSLVLVRAGEHSTALLTDSLEGSREIVVKTLGPHIASVAGVSGATILGDGRIIVILDPVTLVRAQPSGREPAPVAAPVERPLSALVVDDSITMRRVTQRLLERRGVKVLTARDGLDAITVLQEHEVDIILLDIEMPRMDGYQFATHVRNDPRIKDLPIIMITSRSGEKHRAKAIEIGVNDYLSKPYQESQLVAAIGALLGRPL
jgi:chemosensory pili system protein ChpA (sensor histidine kinase/response regulator)